MDERGQATSRQRVRQEEGHALTKGAKQLVVQEALDTILSDGL